MPAAGSVHPLSMRTLVLGRRLISRGPDTTRMLDRLEQRGLVSRQRRSDNRRVVETLITAAGIELLDRMSERVLAMHQQQLGHLQARQLSQLTELLRAAREPHEDSSCDWLNSG